MRFIKAFSVEVLVPLTLIAGADYDISQSLSEVDLAPVLEGQDQLLVGPSKEERDALDRDLWIFLGYLDSQKVFK